MRFWSCFWYLIWISIAAFFIGRLLPKKWFCADMFPWKVWNFEKSGRIYEKLRIRKWMNKVPDMSRILPFMMPAKKIEFGKLDKMDVMIRETCVAEFIHGMNCILGLRCLKLYPGMGGIVIAFLYAFVFNIPYMLIQRYNRPRLIELSNRLKIRELQRAKHYDKREVEINENSDSELQHGRGSQFVCQGNQRVL